MLTLETHCSLSPIPVSFSIQRHSIAADGASSLHAWNPLFFVLQIPIIVDCLPTSNGKGLFFLVKHMGTWLRLNVEYTEYTPQMAAMVNFYMENDAGAVDLGLRYFERMKSAVFLAGAEVTSSKASLGGARFIFQQMGWMRGPK